MARRLAFDDGIAGRELAYAALVPHQMQGGAGGGERACLICWKFSTPMRYLQASLGVAVKQPRGQATVLGDVVTVGLSHTLNVFFGAVGNVARTGMRRQDAAQTTRGEEESIARTREYDSPCI